MTAVRHLDWDDLRYLLAVARGAGLAGAARSLGVNPSTVFRRLNALEAGLGVRLFERRPTGYRTTEAGGDLAAAAERVEAEILALDRRLAGQDARLSGSLRVTAPDDIAETLLMAPIARFLAAYPEIRLEVVIDNRMLSLTRREADVAVRPTLEPPETLIGRKVARLASAVYVAEGAAPAGRAARADDLDERPWIAWDEGVGPAAVARWMARRAPRAPVVYRSNRPVAADPSGLAPHRAGPRLSRFPLRRAQGRASAADRPALAPGHVAGLAGRVGTGREVGLIAHFVEVAERPVHGGKGEHLPGNVLPAEQVKLQGLRPGREFRRAEACAVDQLDLADSGNRVDGQKLIDLDLGPGFLPGLAPRTLGRALVEL
jgi:DNA-binding transcriptional LysR family regulator